MNYFDQYEAANRYAKYRPYYHELVMKHLRRYLQFKHKLPQGLDVFCGNGFSSQALNMICEKVIACDSSAAMLEFAIQNEDITYLQMDDRLQGLTEMSFDILSIASGIHWLDIQKFLLTANKLIKPKGWLLIYDHFILPHQNFLKDWYSDYFIKNFPPPKRNTVDMKNQLVEGLAFIKEEVFIHQISFELEAFVQYLCTQSNVLSVVQSGEFKFEEIEMKLRDELNLLVTDPTTSFPVSFQYQYQLIRKI